MHLAWLECGPTLRGVSHPGAARMATYKELKDQISKLQKSAEEAKAREIKKALDTARELIETYEMTAEQLGLIAAKPVKPKVITPPKYRDPATGKTWNGIGKRPAWIVAAGADTTKLLIPAAEKAVAPAPQGAPKKAAAPTKANGKAAGGKAAEKSKPKKPKGKAAKKALPAVTAKR